MNTTTNYKELLEKDGTLVQFPIGYSMLPMLRQKRDTVVIKRINRKPKENDVVLYLRDDGKYVLHRIIKVKNDGYVIRGDNCYYHEYDITDKHIIGIVATFGSACIKTKVLKEMLTMMGVEYSNTRFDNAILRLHKYHLINFSRCHVEGKEVLKTRFITLTNYGSQYAKNTLNVVHRFNAIAVATVEPYMIKSRAQIAHLISYIFQIIANKM